MDLLDEIRALPAELLAGRDTAAIAGALSEGRTQLVPKEIGNGTIIETIGLAAGNALGMFPAGTVSHWRMGKGIADPAWNATAARMAKRCQATVIPVYFHGRNSLKFNLAGLVHPSARTLLLPSELLNKRGKTIRLTVGAPVPPATCWK